MRLKALLILLISLCITTHVNACLDRSKETYRNGVITIIATTAAIPLFAAGSLVSPILVFGLEYACIVYKLKEILPQLYALQKIKQQRSLSPLEEKLKENLINDFNKFLSLKSEKEWETILQHLMTHHTSKLNRLIATILLPSIHKQCKKNYKLELIAQSRVLTQDELQERTEVIKALKEACSFAPKVDSNADIKTLQKIIKKRTRGIRNLFSAFSTGILPPIMILGAIGYTAGIVMLLLSIEDCC